MNGRLPWQSHCFERVTAGTDVTALTEPRGGAIFAIAPLIKQLDSAPFLAGDQPGILARLGEAWRQPTWLWLARPKVPCPLER